MYTAIIIEPRKHKALYFVLNNFLNNLSNAWKIIIFHGNKNEDYVKNIINKKLIKFKNRISLINLKVDNLTIQEYSNLLKTKDFYKNIPTETFLVFQTDSMILKKHKNLINNFLKYDYVGAPCTTKKYKKYIGNGGLSLRKKSKMLKVIKKKGKNNEIEDVYFSNSFVNKPTIQEAKLFSVEQRFSLRSFGCHKPWGREFSLIYFYLNKEVLQLYRLNK